MCAFVQLLPECRVWINEFHYDNDGGDTGEAVEVAGPAGTDLTDFQLVLYSDGVPSTVSRSAAALPIVTQRRRLDPAGLRFM